MYWCFAADWVPAMIILFLIRAVIPSTTIVCLIYGLQVLGAIYVWFKLGFETETYAEKRHPIAVEASRKQRMWFQLLQRFSLFDAKNVEMKPISSTNELSKNPCERNPTMHPARYVATWKERLRLSIMAVTLVPTRVVAVIGIWLFSWTAVQLCLLGYCKQSLHSKPLPVGWRRTMMCNVVPLCTTLFVYTFGFWHVERTGKRDPRASVIVCNHISFVDPILVASDFWCCGVAAQEHLALPVISDVMRAIQTIFVNRQNSDSRRQVAHVIQQRASTTLTSDTTWPPVLLFPEGTTTNGHTLIRFKPGAFLPRVAVQPVILELPTEAYPNARTSLAWTPKGPPAWLFALRILSEPCNYARVCFLPMQQPSVHEQLLTTDCMVFGERIRSTMSKASGIPLVEMTLDEVLRVDNINNNGQHPREE